MTIRDFKGERPTPAELLVGQIMDIFKSTDCYCGRPKKSRMSHCTKCYMTLPRDMRADLYKPFGRGYEQAFRASLEYLEQKENAK